MKGDEYPPPFTTLKKTLKEAAQLFAAGPYLALILFFYC